MEGLKACLALFPTLTRAVYHRLGLGLFVSAAIVLVLCGLIAISGELYGVNLYVGGHRLTTRVGSGRLSILHESHSDRQYACEVYSLSPHELNTIHCFFDLDATVLVNRWGVEVVAGGYCASVSRGSGLSIHLLYIALLSCIVCAVFYPYRRVQSPRRA